MSKVNSDKSPGIDAKTGLPGDYNSFCSAYRPFMFQIAERANIPLQDREDAVQEVQTKFWMKEGLDMYDPDKKTHFSTLLRNWAGLFMLQEMDKSKKTFRYAPYGLDATTVADPIENDEAKSVLSDEFIKQWLQEAESVLERVEKPHLIPVLRLCVVAAETNTTPSRASIAEAVGTSVSKATSMIMDLRATLTAEGYGIESFYDE